MEVPVQIDFQGCEDIAGLRDKVRDRVNELDERFGRVTAARVVVRAPSGHHKTGGLYEVGVHLTLPDGRMVHAERVPTADERFGDPAFAVGDAFRRARRQLQDEMRRMERQVKHHEPQPTGRVVRIDDSGDFGFIETESGDEVYFHRNALLNAQGGRLRVGARVAFSEEMGREGPQASSVRLLNSR